MPNTQTKAAQLISGESPASMWLSAGLAGLFAVLSGLAGALALWTWLAPQSLANAWPGFSPASLAARDSGLAVPVLKGAIAADPSNARLFTALAQQLRREGKLAEAVAVTKAAADLSHHETASYLWLYLDALSGGRGAEAAVYLDTILRTDPGVLESAVRLAALQRWPADFVAALSERLSQQPPWRRAMVEWLMADEPALDISVRIMRNLAAGGTPLSTREAGILFSRLAGAGRLPDAKDLWLDSLPPERRALAGPLFDSRFETDPQGGPFEWSLGSDPGVSILFVSDPAQPGRVADLDILPGYHGLPLISQTLTLTPGRWRFEGQLTTSGVDAARGLAWWVACVGGEPLKIDDGVSGTMDWHTVSLDFEVPVEGCAAQTIQFGVVAATSADARFGGRVRLGNLDLQPAD